VAGAQPRLKLDIVIQLFYKNSCPWTEYGSEKKQLQRRCTMNSMIATQSQSSEQTSYMSYEADEEVFEIPASAAPHASELMACAESTKCGGSSCSNHAEICD